MPSKPTNSNRVTTTLVLLVGSMTAGAMALNWIHGLTSSAEAATGTLMLARNARGAAWNRILIRPHDAAQADRPFGHFLIDENGRDSRGAAWERQQHDAAQPGTVVVLVAQRSGSTGMGRRQWESLVTRVREVQARYRIPARQIRLDPESAGLNPALQHQISQLNRMLQTAGIIG